jgi:hypothetical protein
MKISRRGASADFGESRIQFNTPTFSWNAANSCITIKQSGVKDFSTDSRHNYTVSFSLMEIQSWLQAISDAAISDPMIFEENFESSLKALLRIQAAIASVTEKRMESRIEIPSH